MCACCIRVQEWIGAAILSHITRRDGSLFELVNCMRALLEQPCTWRLTHASAALHAAAEQSLLSRTDFQVVSMGSTFGRTAGMMSMKVATLPSLGLSHLQSAN